ncbi:hypothetical protein C0991_002815, partial [Blastosporella zonata]
MARPTGREYTGEAAKEFFSVLQAVAEAIPVPGFGAAVKVAANIMKACEESHATLERAQELKLRIKALVLTLVNELKGKKLDEIQAKIILDIEALKREMYYIETKLNDIASQHRLLIILFRSLNEDKVRKCVARLDTSIETFKLARNIEHSDLLTRLEQQISAFHAQQQRSLHDLQASVTSVQLTMDDVKAILDKRLPVGAPSSSPSPTRAVIPANTAIFYGRDSLVAELVGVIVGGSRQHICLMGPGGMGKTSTSLAVMNHPDVEARFPEHLRVWVPCVKAPSASLFIDTLRTSLAISNNSGNPLSDILSVLKTSPPMILLLDNFETPWNAKEGQSDAEQVLRNIHRIPHVIIFITLRSSSPPCSDIPWHRVNLQAVDAAAARDIYISLHPEGREDLDLARLLEQIGHMPLAATLMAKFAASTCLPAERLIEEYNSLGTAVMGQGLDAKTSMDVCIGLSVNSPLMRAHPAAFELLCTISMLPVGTTYDMLSKWWAKKLIGSLDILKETSLVEQRGSTYFALPVIQRYIFHPSRFFKPVHTSMIESACKFLKEHASVIGDELFKSHSEALSVEEGNLEAILLTATASDLHVIKDGFLLLARHQEHHTPRVDIVEHALSLVQTSDDNIHRGDLLLCYGEILAKLHQSSNSVKQLETALGLFLSVSDRKRTAECRLALSTVIREINGSTHKRRKIIREAQEDCKAIGDKDLAARCLLNLALTYRQDYDYHTALSLLQEAEPLFRAKNRYQHTVCSQSISTVHYYTGDYDPAYTWATSALDECASIGN